MDKRLIIGGMKADEIKPVLLAIVTSELQLRAGFVPDKMSVTEVTQTPPKALAMYRIKPVFKMSYGWFDPAIEWLYENLDSRDYPFSAYIYRKQIIIQGIVDCIREYVRLLDYRHKTGEL